MPYPHCNRLIIISCKQPSSGHQECPSVQLIESGRRQWRHTSSSCVLNQPQVTSNGDNQLHIFVRSRYNCGVERMNHSNINIVRFQVDRGHIKCIFRVRNNFSFYNAYIRPKNGRYTRITSNQIKSSFI